MLDLDTGELRQLRPCDSYACASCSARKLDRLRSQVLLGLDVADEHGRAATVLHLTLAGHDHLDLARAALARLAEALRRAPRGEPRRRTDYVAAIEFGPSSGRLHIHVAVLHSEHLPARRWRQLAAKAGFGPILRVAPVQPTAQDRARVAGYLCKDAPATAALLRRGGVQRAHPVTFSRGWPQIA